MSVGAFKVLSRAKDLIASPDKWCQHHSYQPGDKRDLLAALLDGGADMPTQFRAEALDALRIHTEGMPLTVYNDSPHTTHAHVYALLERAMDHVQPGWR